MAGAGHDEQKELMMIFSSFELGAPFSLIGRRSADDSRAHRTITSLAVTLILTLFASLDSSCARAELRSWRSSVDEVVVGEMDSAPLPASGASLDVVVNELPMDFNGCFICTNGEPVSPHTRRPYCGHGARTVGGGVKR